MVENEFGVQVREDCDPEPDVQRLQDLSEQALWSANEARMILAGLHPECTGECRDSRGTSYHYITLPGVLDKHSCEKADSFDFHQNIQGTLRYLTGFVSGESQSPDYWVNKALEKDYQIPWFETARQSGIMQEAKTKAESEAARELKIIQDAKNEARLKAARQLKISQDAKNEAEAELDRLSKIMREAQINAETYSEHRRSGGIGKNRNSFKGEFKLVVVVAWDRQFSRRKSCGEPGLRGEISKFIRVYTDRFFELFPIDEPESDRPGERTLSGWVTDLKKNLFEKQSFEWLDRYRADPQYEIVDRHTKIEEMLQAAKQSAS